MQEKEKRFYKLIGKIALEFRVSLNNLCKLLGKEDTEENRMLIYNKIEQSTTENNYYLSLQYRYLFFYETLNEPSEISNKSYVEALDFLKEYKKAIASGNREEVKILLKELSKTEYDFQKIKNKIKEKKLTDEEIIIISKYRMKNIISREYFCNMNPMISSRHLMRRENNLSSDIIKYKLKLFSEYLLDINNTKSRRL